MSGRLLMSGLVAFALIFGAALWWFQTRAHYVEVSGLTEVEIAGEAVAATGYRGIDGDSSPLKIRACFVLPGGATGVAAEAPTPLAAPGWFDCFDAKAIAADLASGTASAVLAGADQPPGFDRIVAVYPDGRGYLWRQINKCGKARFDGDPPPAGCAEASD